MKYVYLFLVLFFSNRSIGQANSGFGVWGDFQANAHLKNYQPVGLENAPERANFGSAVSISGNFAAIGAKHDHGGNVNSKPGLVSIYFFDGKNWIFKQNIKASDALPDDLFGSSVSMSNNSLAVGAPNRDAVYVFFLNGSTWVQQQKIEAPDGKSGIDFGKSVSISGRHLAVGAPLDKIGSNSSQGSAYFYFNNGVTCINGICWKLKNKITPEDGGINDHFGTSVSVSGNDAVVGAPSVSHGFKVENPHQGAAYLLSFNGQNWEMRNGGKLRSGSDDTKENKFGFSVIIAGNNLIVGSPSEPNFNSNGFPEAGGAFIYKKTNETWILSQIIQPPDGEKFDDFGKSLSISDAHILIGAPGDDTEQSVNHGSAFIYHNIAGIWRLFQKVTDPGRSANNDAFGNSCAVSNNNRFIIGAVGVAGATGMAFFGRINKE